jgi:predicted site-specific integrase-resolvase
MKMDKIYKLREFGSLIGKSWQTLQLWDRLGKLKAKRNPVSNRRYYTHDQYLEYIGIKATGNAKTVVYCRVLSNNQKKDLETQIKSIETYCISKGIKVDDWISEIGSGLNFKRKKWNILLDEIEMGKVKTLIVAHKDRFVRFGFEWYELFLQKHGCDLEVINMESLSPQEEMTKDLMTIINDFSLRLSGLRRYKNKIKKIVEDETKNETND